jgi:exonuclease III
MNVPQQAYQNDRRKTLRIWQQNLNKAKNAQQHLLCNLDPQKYNITAIQELVINYVNLTTSNPHWNIIYPTTHHTTNTKRTRSIMLVNKRISKDHWRTLPMESPDITAMELSGEFGKLRIYNVYNDGTHSQTLKYLASHLAAQQRPAQNNDTSSILLLGDFNRHHPMWDHPNNHHLFTTSNLNAAKPLLDIMVMYDLKMALLTGIPTL